MTTKRILIIDDEPDIREVVRVTLDTTRGWAVIVAASGREGLTRAADERPDAILLDVMMPDLDGPATFERLRAGTVTREIPVLLLTAKLQLADRRRFAELGVRGVIDKPFDPLVLGHQIATALGWLEG